MNNRLKLQIGMFKKRVLKYQFWSYKFKTKVTLKNKFKWKKQKKINLKTLKPYMKIYTKSIKLGDTEIEEDKFLQYKSPTLIDNIDINKIVVYNKVSFGKKHFK